LEIQKVQDIQKEEFLLCPDCENGVSIFESNKYIYLKTKQVYQSTTMNAPVS
jgi:hypothetical protein